MKVLITGVAGFIGFHLAQQLLAEDVRVVGLDCLTPYYDITLKEARIRRLAANTNFDFHRLNLTDRVTIMAKQQSLQADIVVHLAAQPGVQYSLENPFSYAESNLTGHLTVLELCRQMEGLQHLVYASSSSVYGANSKLPFSVDDTVDQPVSLYAATKRSGELMAQTYSHLYGIPMTGLRFFTVYGPWGRPDMAAWKFTEAILNDRPITVNNHGKMKRDFTYIDDIIAGLRAVMPLAPSADKDAAPHRLYNLGNHRSENLTDFIKIIEEATGKKATLQMADLPKGEVIDTFADIKASQNDFGFKPQTSIKEGIPKFVEWYKRYHNL